MNHEPLIICTHGLRNQPLEIEASYKSILYPKTETEIQFFRWDHLLNRGLPSQIGSQAEKASFLLPPPWNVIAYPIADKVGDFVGDYFSYEGQREKTFVHLNQFIRKADPSGQRPLILIGHSMGSILFYEFICYLQNFHPSKEPLMNIHSLITLGSPIDRKPVRNKVLTYVKGIKRPNVKLWKNYHNKFDFVTDWIPFLTGDIEHFSPDVQVSNGGGHNALRYLAHIDPKDLTITGS